MRSKQNDSSAARKDASIGSTNIHTPDDSFTSSRPSILQSVRGSLDSTLKSPLESSRESVLKSSNNNASECHRFDTERLLNHPIHPPSNPRNSVHIMSTNHSPPPNLPPSPPPDHHSDHHSDQQFQLQDPPHRLSEPPPYQTKLICTQVAPLDSRLPDETNISNQFNSPEQSSIKNSRNITTLHTSPCLSSLQLTSSELNQDSVKCRPIPPTSDQIDSADPKPHKNSNNHLHVETCIFPPFSENLSDLKVRLWYIAY